MAPSAAGEPIQRKAGQRPAPCGARRAALALFCVCLVAYGYFLYRGPHHNPDSRLALTYAVVERQVLDIDADAGGTLDRALLHGHFYTDKAPGLSFLLVPLYAGLRLVLPAELLSLPQGESRGPTPSVGPGEFHRGFGVGAGVETAPDRFVARYLLTFFGLGVPAALFGAFFFTWLGRFDARIGPRLAVAGGYALGSPVYPFAVSAFGHVPAGMCLFGAFAALCPLPSGRAVGNRRETLAGALLGLAVALEYPAALGAVPLVAYGLWRAPRRGPFLARLLAGAAAPLLLLLAYQHAVFGRPWGVGYAHLDPGTVYAQGQAGGFLGVRLPDPGVALALLAGAQRGLLVHAPWLLLAVPGAVLLWRRGPEGQAPRHLGRAECAAALGVVGALLLVNSGYVFWDGGASWGPRHLVPALPFGALLAFPAAVRWPRAALLLAGASVLLTLAAVATRTLPDVSASVPLRDLLLPRTLRGEVTNNWGQLAGLRAWRGLAPLFALALLAGAWATGWRRSVGWLVAGLWALLAGATLHRAYLEYSEGYYLYLGSRLAAGARLYADAASTQPPLLPLAVSLLWRVAPDVYLPRLLAVGLYVVTALLAGRLAQRVSGDRRVGALATLLAALLPLGAGAVPVLDANAVLAPLGPALALLLPRHPLLAGVVAAAGLSTKLTFLPLALAPLGAALLAPGAGVTRWPPPWRHLWRHPWLLPYVAGATLTAGLHLALWLALAGPAVLDGVLGELESPLLPLGAVLAVAQLLQLEGPLLAFAAWGWWRWRPGRWPVGAVVWCCGLAAATLPLFALHQGTFVGVARPAEPFFAAYAALSLAGLPSLLSGARAGRGAVSAAFALALAMMLAVPLWHTRRALTAGPVAGPEMVVERLSAASAAGGPDGSGGAVGDVLAPPYYAALAGRRMLYDYADWTVWGMRSAAGAAHERALNRRLVATLEGGDLAQVAADFRLTYLPDVAAALERSYVRVGDDGDDPARRVAFFVPRGACCAARASGTAAGAAASAAPE